ncbi:MAG: hypothetical protein ABI824_05540 [Acidobacteriota bacterium]
MTIRLIPGIVLSLVMAATLGAQTPAPAKTDAAPKAKMAKAAPVMVSDADIAAAKAHGMVWVNTSTKVYHMSDNTQFYGKTKQGKFMTEADAKAAKYTAAKENAPKKVAKAKTNAPKAK